jgi:hypothetical protein
MTTVLIGSLLAVILVTAKMWHNLKLENDHLRSQVASLKRQLGKNGNGRGR